MLIFGAGGHAKVVLGILSAHGELVHAVFDDNAASTALHGKHIVCGYDPFFMPNEGLIIAIGNNHDRRRVAGKLSHSFGNAIHPTATVDPSADIGLGIVIVHNAVVQVDCRIGNHVIINTGSIIDHECMLDDFAHVGPGATLCGGVYVGERTLVGAGSVILPQVKVGRECVIGAGSVVVRDVPDYAKVAGNPARIIY